MINWVFVEGNGRDQQNSQNSLQITGLKFDILYLKSVTGTGFPSMKQQQKI
jgi:hypothetical protein